MINLFMNDYKGLLLNPVDYIHPQQILWYLKKTRLYVLLYRNVFVFKEFDHSNRYLKSETSYDIIRHCEIIPHKREWAYSANRCLMFFSCLLEWLVIFPLCPAQCHINGKFILHAIHPQKLELMILTNKNKHFEFSHNIK